MSEARYTSSPLADLLGAIQPEPGFARRVLMEHHRRPKPRIWFRVSHERSRSMLAAVVMLTVVAAPSAAWVAGRSVAVPPADFVNDAAAPLPTDSGTPTDAPSTMSRPAGLPAAVRGDGGGSEPVAPTTTRRPATPSAGGWDVTREDTRSNRGGKVQRTDSVCCDGPVPQCLANSQEAPNTVWCMYASVTAGPGTQHNLSFQVCRPGFSDRTDGIVSFDTNQEVDFAVLDKNYAPVWRWSRGQTFHPEAHQLTIVSGQCSQWDFAWSGMNDSGARVPAGQYFLRAMTKGKEIPDPTAPDVSFSIH